MTTLYADPPTKKLHRPEGQCSFDLPMDCRMITVLNPRNYFLIFMVSL